jgi:hypothetical protein
MKITGGRRRKIKDISVANTSTNLDNTLKISALNMTTTEGFRLTNEENSILENCKSEMYLNKILNNLYNQCNNKNYYVPMLTDIVGNCLFEALVYHKIGTDVTDLRNILSIIFYIFKDYKEFLPNIQETLQELFTFSNEIEYIYTRDKISGEKNFYKYNYIAMCQDLENSYCWNRLPTQLILLVVSYLYRVEIIIIHSDNDYETKN